MVRWALRVARPHGRTARAGPAPSRFRSAAGSPRRSCQASLEGLLDRPALTALVDEPVLEVVSEAEVAAVSLGERRFADDRDEPSQVASARQRRVELVGDGAVVLTGLALLRCRRS